MTTLFVLLWMIMAAYSILFLILYVCVVLLRINDAQLKVRKPGILFRQQRYVECYLGLLTGKEKSRWYNVFLKHSFDIGLVLSTLLLATIITTVVRGAR
jgi:hypothetical protein